MVEVLEADGLPFSDELVTWFTRVGGVEVSEPTYVSTRYLVVPDCEPLSLDRAAATRRNLVELIGRPADLQAYRPGAGAAVAHRGDGPRECPVSRACVR